MLGLPGLKRIAIIANSEHSSEPLEFKAAQEAATRLGIFYRYFPVAKVSSNWRLSTSRVDATRRSSRSPTGSR
jgi:hypothetical protein